MNLPIALVQKWESRIAERAKENQLSTLKQNVDNTVLVNLPKRTPIDTRREMAALARVSEKTYAKGKVRG